MTPLWPHQVYGIQETARRISNGERRVCLTSPTGGGKSLMMIRLTEWALENDWPVVVYSPRKMLIEQMARAFREHGVPFGIRSADFEEELRMGEPVQLSSPATEDARCFRRVRWQPHNAKFVLVDEIHMQKGQTIRRLMQHHLDREAAIVLVTATPIGIADMADSLVVAGNNTQLRECGALLPCYVYGCEEIDTAKIKTRRDDGEFAYADIKAHWPPEIFGHVLTHWKELNPERKPAILFAPGVAESIWFAQEFEKAGFRWAHIDGEDVYLDGEFHKSSRDVRDEVIRQLKNGSILGICNRFVMREGVDLPCLYHGILATPIGSLVSYVQVVGRILRAHPSLDEVIIQDHGGSWWRHGSPNQDRDWEAYWQAPPHFWTETRAERIRSKKEPEPIHCPKCHSIRLSGDTCHDCGFRHTTRSRIVIQHNGQLREMKGDIFRERRRERRGNTQQIWTQCVMRCRNAKRPMTFRQAEGLFFYENHYYPPRDLEFMPKNEADWFRAVRDVLPDRIGATR